MRRLLLITALLTLPTAVSAEAKTRWVVKGGGWGHGLGMSQYGAYGQARAGRGYRKIVSHYYRNTRFGKAKGTVRVLLLASVPQSTFSGANRVGRHRVSARRAYSVHRKGSRIVVRNPRGKRVAAKAGVLRVMGPGGRVSVAGKGTYRDVIEYRPGLSGGVTAVNKVELENYIRGVVPLESPASWPIEALKAQAVAARSYALGTGTGNAVFDHYDTTASQVYGGYSAEQPSTNRAVAKTRGVVLKHRGKVIVAYFHSTSGGHTEDIENIFTGGSRLAYIRGVRDPWDRFSPYHRWQLGYSARALGASLGVGTLRSVKVQRRGVSGRIVYAVFRGTAGKRRLHGWSGIRAALVLRDAPERFKRIRSRGSTAGAAVAGAGSRARARDIAGSITPARPGAQVVLERRTEDGWKRVDEDRLGRSGRYRIPVRTRGVYRVLSAGDAGPTVRVR
ncbi:MAG TPA: SpoIID/LytB domain-containing protein [Thermoleophilaceae bacterium]|nr:SpoIID/LytB domain-containing protein [Thermoleophilaceae bacterium]